MLFFGAGASTSSQGFAREGKRLLCFGFGFVPYTLGEMMASGLAAGFDNGGFFGGLLARPGWKGLHIWKRGHKVG